MLPAQFGEEVSVASSVALVSEMSANESHSPQPYFSMSSGENPASLWGQEASSATVGSLAPASPLQLLHCSTFFC